MAPQVILNGIDQVAVPDPATLAAEELEEALHFIRLQVDVVRTFWNSSRSITPSPFLSNWRNLRLNANLDVVLSFILSEMT